MTNTDAATITFIIPCGASKLDHTAPAANLYTGSMFQHTLTAAQTEAAATERDLGVNTQILILSALHGLITLDTVLDPYNVKMGDTDSVTPSDVAITALDHNLTGEVFAMLPTTYYDTLAAGLAILDIYPARVYEAAPGIGYQRGVNSSLVRNT